MSGAVLLYIFSLVCLCIAPLVKKAPLANGVFTATGLGLCAASFWASTPAQWFAIGGVMAWVYVVVAALSLVGGVVEESRG